MSSGNSNSKSRVVFVGNIPYEMTEEQLVDIFKEVGPVTSFRLMFDRETGKARGYGFCEYADTETAASAIRNLNGYDVGGRTLRVDRADQEMQGATYVPSQPVAAGTPTLDSINSTLSAMNNTQLLQVMSQMKGMATSNPEQTRQLLHGNPSLTFALFQAMVMLNLVDPSMVQQTAATSTTTTATNPPQPARQQQPPIVQSIPQSAPNAEQQRAIIAQIMSLTPEQISALPPQQRDQVLQLRAQLSNQQPR